MLNTQKLLYILPDLAYIAELVPDKKPNAFSIQSFKQVNGEFFKSNKLIPEHVAKLFNKLEAGETYTVVLPDFLFTNTIVSVQETTESKIKSKLQEEVLDGLKLTPDSHLIETTSLNELKGTTRVQISAIDKTLLEVLQVAVEEKGVSVDAVVPLSWSIKAMISLEPSISVIQMGNFLYIAEHYIGVDQTSDSKVTDVQKIAETVRTLKGAEPSIQTLYLLSDSKVEKSLKTELKGVVPLQQMAHKDTDEKLPSHIQVVIEAALKTLSIADFPAPKFGLGKPPQEAVKKFAPIFANDTETAEDSETENRASLPKPNSPADDAIADTAAAGLAVGAATTVASTAGAAAQVASAGVGTGTNEIRTDVDMPATNPKSTEQEKESKKEPEEKAVEEIEEIEESATTADDVAKTPEDDASEDDEPTNTTDKDEVGSDQAKKEDSTEAEDGESAGEKDQINTTEDKTKDGDASQDEDQESADEEKGDEEQKAWDDGVADDIVIAAVPTAESETKASSDDAVESKTAEAEVDAGKIDASVVKPAQESSVNTDEAEEIDLSQFTQLGGETEAETSEKAVESGASLGVAVPDKKTIKNKSGVNHMLKMILITTGVFVLTVAIGIGVGMAIIKFTNQGDQPAPSVEVEESPAMEATPAPTPEDSEATDASPSAALDKSGVSILVVNATTKAGYAGTIKTDLESGDFENVTAGNAKGEYTETGVFVYLAEDNQDLVDAMAEATGLELTISETAKAEDPQSKYDVVIVLAE